MDSTNPFPVTSLGCDTEHQTEMEVYFCSTEVLAVAWITGKYKNRSWFFDELCDLRSSLLYLC